MSAEKRYNDLQDKINAQLERIRLDVLAHKTGASQHGIDYAHVGDLAAVSDKLDEIIRFITEENS